MPAYCYFTFPTTFYAIRAEAVLKKTTRSFKMVPVPRNISTSCGTALRCLPPDKESIAILLKEHKVEVEGIFEQ